MTGHAFQAKQWKIHFRWLKNALRHQANILIRWIVKLQREHFHSFIAICNKRNTRQF